MQASHMYGFVQAGQPKYEAFDARSLHMVSALPLQLHIEVRQQPTADL